MPLKNWCSIRARWSKSSLKHSIRFCAIFPSLKQNYIAYHSSKVSWRPDFIFEIHQLCQSGFNRVYSNCCSSYSFVFKIIKIGPSSHKMYSNNILNFQESTTILNACTRKSGNLLTAPCIFLFLCLSIFLFLPFSIYLSIYFSNTHSTTHTYVHTHTHTHKIYVGIYFYFSLYFPLPIFQCITHIYIYVYIVCLSVFLFVSLFIYF